MAEVKEKKGFLGKLIGNGKGKKGNFGKRRRNDRDSERNRKDRVAKRLAMLGVASRREAEQFVKDGKVKINGIECKDLSFLVSYDDKIAVNGKEIANKPIKTEIYLMNKPAGYVTTNNDPQGRKTIFELIPNKFGRLMAVGRLDMNTEGLILLTNNGEVARILEMPATQLKRIYFARVVGEINDKVEKQLQDLRNGIDIEGIHYGKMIVEKQPKVPDKSYNTLKIIIFEGKNNEIRRVMWHLGLKVVKLTRVQYGDFHLKGLPSGCIQLSRVPLHIRDLERRASANMKAYNQGKIAGKIAEKNKEEYLKNKAEKNKEEEKNDDKNNNEKDKKKENKKIAKKDVVDNAVELKDNTTENNKSEGQIDNNSTTIKTEQAEKTEE